MMENIDMMFKVVLKKACPNIKVKYQCMHKDH